MRSTLFEVYLGKFQFMVTLKNGSLKQQIYNLLCSEFYWIGSLCKHLERGCQFSSFFTIFLRLHFSNSFFSGSIDGNFLPNSFFYGLLYFAVINKSLVNFTNSFTRNFYAHRIWSFFGEPRLANRKKFGQFLGDFDLILTNLNLILAFNFDLILAFNFDLILAFNFDLILTFNLLVKMNGKFFAKRRKPTTFYLAKKVW